MNQIEDLTVLNPENRAKMAITVNMGTVNTGSPGNSEKMASTATRLVQIAFENHLPFTWAVDSAEQLHWIGPIQKCSVKQDFALAVGNTWSDSNVSQGTFRDQLSCHLESFQLAGCSLKSVSVSSTCNSRPWLGQMAQQGLKTVLVNTSDHQANKDRNNVAPRPMPWGLWGFSANAHLPTKHRWLRLNSSIRLPNSGHSNKDSSRMHVMIHVQQIASQGRRALQQVRQFLHKIAWAKSARELEVVTAADWVRTEAENSTVQPQRSILRIAA